VWKRKIYWNQPTGLSLFLGSEWNSLAEMSSGLYRRGQPMGEGQHLWSLIICDHQMEQLSNWKFLRGFVSREIIRETRQVGGVLASGHKSAGLVSVLASGPSACPKSARDLAISIA
jgi:hypothetical protein